MPRAYPYHPVRRAVGRGLFRLAWRRPGPAAVPLAPVTVAAAAAFWYGLVARRAAAAGRRGRLWCLPMVAAWLVAVAGGRAAARPPGDAAAGGAGAPAGAGPGAWWFRVAAAPYRALAAMWQLAGHGHLAAAVIAAAPAAIPLGIAAGGAGWAYRRLRMRSGAGGLTPESPGAFDARQWQHQVRAARALIAAPGSLPLLSRRGTW